MKKSKVLIGLIMVSIVAMSGTAFAQTKANYKNYLREVGPDNIGGRCRAIIADMQDASGSTLYAGGVAGGLYKLNVGSTWEYMPFHTANGELTLPISAMSQLSNGTIVIGTGESYVAHNVNNGLMGPRGRGLYLFNPATSQFTLVNNTDSDTNFAYINCVTSQRSGDATQVYVGTTKGLFRWTLRSESDWSTTPTQLYDGAVEDVELMEAYNIAFFTSGGTLHKIGNVSANSTAQDITGNLVSVGDDIARIELTSTIVDGEPYIYALVARSNGLMKGVYLSTDQQSWLEVSTPTVALFNAENPGRHNSAITIDPTNPKHIYIGGATLWEGTGYVEGSRYIWKKVSYSESELNMGNYMGGVYIIPYFLHSGIHQILPVYNGYTTTYYVATDGGVYNYDGENTFININKGFNTVQFNSIAVSPDGSVIGGAVDNSFAFVQSRSNHDGGSTAQTWYDTIENTAMNHAASIIGTGNGASVQASKFQQVKSDKRRGLFLTATSGFVGRSYADYADYTNTQTWTYGTAFTSNSISNTTAMPQMVLWETDNNTSWNDSISFTLDTAGVIIRDGKEITISGDSVIRKGDKVYVNVFGNYNYPFLHEFDTTFVAKEKMTHDVHNLVASRIFLTAKTATGINTVYMNTTPNDYSKVWTSDDASAGRASKIMNWIDIFHCSESFSIGRIAVSNKADAVFVSVENDSTKENFVVRVRGINKSNVNDISTLATQIQFLNPSKEFNENRITEVDTIHYNDTAFLFNRPVSSLTVDKRDGKDILYISFAGDNADETNFAVVYNATDSVYRYEAKPVVNAAEGMTQASPVYSAMVEYTTGKVFAGTEEGVFTSEDASIHSSSPAWSTYGAFKGVPVTSMVQQTDTLKRIRFAVHDGFNVTNYVYARTKYPYAMYFGTYGRGIFMDMQYVTDTTNEYMEPEDWAGISNVDKGDNHIAIYPNPASERATLDITVATPGNATMRIYDITGRVVRTEQLGRLAEGTHTYNIDVQNLNSGMYLVNIHVGKNTATSKLMVR
ncbi:MAG: T9SS type A sorting domain-containing protein [Bacteroidales bacterium]|nr:T9SS type A sorting domain-containing protein [Bacteroidales bacterium]